MKVVKTSLIGSKAIVASIGCYAHSILNRSITCRLGVAALGLLLAFEARAASILVDLRNEDHIAILEADVAKGIDMSDFKTVLPKADAVCLAKGHLRAVPGDYRHRVASSNDYVFSSVRCVTDEVRANAIKILSPEEDYIVTNLPSSTENSGDQKNHLAGTSFAPGVAVNTMSFLGSRDIINFATAFKGNLQKAKSWGFPWSAAGERLAKCKFSSSSDVLVHDEDNDEGKVWNAIKGLNKWAAALRGVSASLQTILARRSLSDVERARVSFTLDRAEALKKNLGGEYIKFLRNHKHLEKDQVISAAKTISGLGVSPAHYLKDFEKAGLSLERMIFAIPGDKQILEIALAKYDRQNERHRVPRLIYRLRGGMGVDRQELTGLAEAMIGFHEGRQLRGYDALQMLLVPFHEGHQFREYFALALAKYPETYQHVFDKVRVFLGKSNPPEEGSFDVKYVFEALVAHAPKGIMLEIDLDLIEKIFLLGRKWPFSYLSEILTTLLRTFPESSPGRVRALALLSKLDPVGQVGALAPLVDLLNPTSIDSSDLSKIFRDASLAMIEEVVQYHDQYRILPTDQGHGYLQDIFRKLAECGPFNKEFRERLNKLVEDIKDETITLPLRVVLDTFPKNAPKSGTGARMSNPLQRTESETSLPAGAILDGNAGDSKRSL